MVKIVESDNKVPLSAQLEEDVGPVILMNKFNVGPDEVDEFLKVFEETTKYLNDNLDLFPHNCIGVLPAVPPSLIM